MKLRAACFDTGNPVVELGSYIQGRCGAVKPPTDYDRLSIR